jgi:hypothetical protein
VQAKICRYVKEPLVAAAPTYISRARGVAPGGGKAIHAEMEAARRLLGGVPVLKLPAAKVCVIVLLRAATTCPPTPVLCTLWAYFVVGVCVSILGACCRTEGRRAVDQGKHGGCAR